MIRIKEFNEANISKEVDITPILLLFAGIFSTGITIYRTQKNRRTDKLNKNDIS